MFRVETIIKSIPNALTVLRIILIPILIISFYLEGKMSHYVSAGIFIFASITDYVDGVLARYWKAQSNFGRMLDPIADKMLVASTLLMLVDQRIAPVIPIVIILCREIFVSGMREYLGSIQKAIPVRFVGKLKTAIQMVAIITLLLGENGVFGEACLWVAAILTLLSGAFYFVEGLKHI
jgi:CDP-diacylglycerol--glycerol-3-phosphate 3-phosphatidyltransferase